MAVDGRAHGLEYNVITPEGPAVLVTTEELSLLDSGRVLSSVELAAHLDTQTAVIWALAEAGAVPASLDSSDNLVFDSNLFNLWPPAVLVFSDGTVRDVSLGSVEPTDGMRLSTSSEG